MIRVKSHKRKGRAVRSHTRKPSGSMKGRFNPLTGNWVGPSDDSEEAKNITRKVLSRKEAKPWVNSSPKSGNPPNKKNKVFKPVKVKVPASRKVKVSTGKPGISYLKRIGAVKTATVKAAGLAESASSKYLHTRF